mmetsp:Transcript_593/g.1415  ORF Transcript_593/g.1415 Transcript_593/m.1415 type:complete len:325 (+) Transcript_593:238-1212(+)
MSESRNGCRSPSDGACTPSDATCKPVPRAVMAWSAATDLCSAAISLPQRWPSGNGMNAGNNLGDVETPCSATPTGGGRGGGRSANRAHAAAADSSAAEARSSATATSPRARSALSSACRRSSAARSRSFAAFARAASASSCLPPNAVKSARSFAAIASELCSSVSVLRSCATSSLRWVAKSMVAQSKAAQRSVTSCRRSATWFCSTVISASRWATFSSERHMVSLRTASSVVRSRAISPWNVATLSFAPCNSSSAVCKWARTEKSDVWCSSRVLRSRPSCPSRLAMVSASCCSRRFPSVTSSSRSSLALCSRNKSWRSFCSSLL